MSNQAVAAITLDKATVLISIFIIVSNIIEQQNIQKALTRPGPAPDCSDADLITAAIYREMIGDPREDHFFRMNEGILRDYFPGFSSRTRYNRRKKNLAWIILLVRMAILHALGFDQAVLALIDSAPVPVTGYRRDKSLGWNDIAAYGRCASKAMKFYGCKLTTLMSEQGVILDFALTAANHYDNQVVPELLAQYNDQHPGVLKTVIGDKAYNSQFLQEDMLNDFGITLKAPKKDNQEKRADDIFLSSRSDAALRLMVETGNSQLQEQFHLSKHYAKSVAGFFARIAAKITAHTVGIAVNIMLGRPPLALAGLAY